MTSIALPRASTVLPKNFPTCCSVSHELRSITNSRRRHNNRLMNEINVVPYIDVMLVLLVIFMVTAPLMNPGQIDLPKWASRRRLRRSVGDHHQKRYDAGHARPCQGRQGSRVCHATI